MTLYYEWYSRECTCTYKLPSMLSANSFEWSYEAAWWSVYLLMRYALGLLLDDELRWSIEDHQSISVYIYFLWWDIFLMSKDQQLMTHPLCINNIYNGSELAIVRTVVNKHYSANFHKSCEHLSYNQQKSSSFSFQKYRSYKSPPLPLWMNMKLRLKSLVKVVDEQTVEFWLEATKKIVKWYVQFLNES